VTSALGSPPENRVAAGGMAWSGSSIAMTGTPLISRRRGSADPSGMLLQCISGLLQHLMDHLRSGRGARLGGAERLERRRLSCGLGLSAGWLRDRPVTPPVRQE
jgi:hypothetical protein